jgi:hypothetical protein
MSKKTPPLRWNFYLGLILEIVGYTIVFRATYLILVFIINREESRRASLPTPVFLGITGIAMLYLGLVLWHRHKKRRIASSPRR